ncbi:hypothetical protein TWF106_010077 [Orbilia oligospora]|uniref:Uncharacterized protein n=1 Tax=Orbilia oligospora TaxID=2813651 RepID=A0A7C8QJV2_ORBOL|nr:hypothetical protein TWF106_010077 [Orbilia oligospora]
MSDRASGSTSTSTDTFTVNLTPELPDRETMLPNMTYGNISPDDYLSKVADGFENFEGVPDMLLPGEIWRYYHGGNGKELKKRHTFKRNGMLPDEESGKYTDVIARPGLPRGSN